jgi:hypothetical protein
MVVAGQRQTYNMCLDGLPQQHEAVVLNNHKAGPGHCKKLLLPNTISPGTSGIDQGCVWVTVLLLELAM